MRERKAAAGTSGMSTATKQATSFGELPSCSKSLVQTLLSFGYLIMQSMHSACRPTSLPVDNSHNELLILTRLLLAFCSDILSDPHVYKPNSHASGSLHSAPAGEAFQGYAVLLAYTWRA